MGNDSTLAAGLARAESAVKEAFRVRDVTLTVIQNRNPFHVVVEVTPEAGLLDDLAPDDVARFHELRSEPNGSCTFQDGTTLSFVEKLSAVFLYAQIWIANTYFRHGITLRDGAQLVDVGANIGTVSIAANKVWKDLKVLSIEPVPATARALRRNLVHHGIAPIVEECAVGSQSGTVEFFSRPWAPNIAGRTDLAASVGGMRAFRAEMLRNIRTVAVPESFIATVDGYGFHTSDVARLLEYAVRELAESLEQPELADRADERITCPSRTLDEILDAHGIDTVDLLKIDIEGGAAEVITSISPRRWPTIQQVVMECDKEIFSVANHLRDQGFSVVLSKRHETADLAELASGHLYATRPSGSEAPQIRDLAAGGKGPPVFLGYMAELVLQTLLHVNATAVKERYTRAITQTVLRALNRYSPGTVSVVLRGNAKASG
jgi:FkbM family methyltransferase